MVWLAVKLTRSASPVKNNFSDRCFYQCVALVILTTETANVSMMSVHRDHHLIRKVEYGGVLRHNLDTIGKG